MPSTSGGRKSKKRKIKNHDPAFDRISAKKVLGLALRAGSGTFLYFREVRNNLRFLSLALLLVPCASFYRMDFWKKLGHINEVFPGVLYVQEGNRMENRGETYGKEEKLYTVGDVCEQMGITRKTLFYYDQIGLLKPSERVSSQQVKLYDSEKIARLRCILQYREAGLRISEIRELLDDQNVHRLSILQAAMTRLQKERDGVEQEIVNLTKLIEAEKRATLS